MRSTTAQRLSLLPLLVLLLVPSSARAQARPAGTAELGTGSVTLQAKQDGTGLILVVSTDLAGIVGMRVSVPDEPEDLVRITAQGGERALEEEAASRTAKAVLSSSVEALSGPYQVAITHDLSQASALALTLYRANGRAFPLTVNGLAPEIKVVFKLLGDNCVETTSTCGPPNPCTVSTTCCGAGAANVCLDCRNCTIKCPPCSLL